MEWWMRLRRRRRTNAILRRRRHKYCCQKMTFKRMNLISHTSSWILSDLTLPMKPYKIEDCYSECARAFPGQTLGQIGRQSRFRIEIWFLTSHPGFYADLTLSMKPHEKQDCYWECEWVFLGQTFGQIGGQSVLKTKVWFLTQVILDSNWSVISVEALWKLGL